MATRHIMFNYRSLVPILKLIFLYTSFHALPHPNKGKLFVHLLLQIV